jgi:hypothetical protein
MFAADHYQRAAELVEQVEAMTTDDRRDPKFSLDIAKVHVELANVRGFVAAGMADEMIPAERKAWQELLGTDQPAPDPVVVEARGMTTAGKVNTARPARNLDQQIENALSGLFDADVAAEIRTSEAYGALRYRIGSYIAMHPDRDPAYVLGYLLDAGTRNFARVADNPAAYLAKQIGELE